MSHIAHTNESRCIYELVSAVTRMNVHTYVLYELVCTHVYVVGISLPWHIWMRLVIRGNESWHMHEKVILHIRMSHVVHSIMSCCAYGHGVVRHDSCICVPWLSRMCDMTHLYLQHDSSMRLTWSIHMCALTHSYMWHDSCACVTEVIGMCDMTHSYLRYDLLISVTWLIRAYIHTYINTYILRARGRYRVAKTHRMP